MKKEILNEQLNQCHSEQSEGSCKILRDVSLRMTGQAGRSMVEMLGVLAVIGVLTVIGITGFRVALNKHYANQTVERLMRRAVVLAGQANFGQNPSLHEFDENDGEYPISRTLKSTSESFTMRVDNVPQEVCQQIVGMEWKLAKIIPENCSDETMEFMFLNDLTDCTDCQPDTFPCEDYGKECGKCSVVKGYTRNDDDCSDEDKPYCVLGKCSKCAPGQTTYNDGCKACSQINDVIISADDCHSCVDNLGNASHFQNTIGECYKCSDTSWSGHRTSTLEECNRCPNRCLRRDNNICGEPGRSEYAGGTGGRNFIPYALDPQGSGYCVCAENFYPDQNGTCHSCDQINDIIISADDCHSCVDNLGNASHFQNTIGECYKCSDTSWSGYRTATLEECNRCSNRCLRRDNNICGEPNVKYTNGPNFAGYALDPQNSGYCVCTTGYHMENNVCVAD